MNKIMLFAAGAALLLPATTFAGNARQCSTGKLLDVQENVETVGTFQVGRAQEKRRSDGQREWTTFNPPATRQKITYSVTVALDGMVYTGRSGGEFWNYKPTSLTVNDPIPACVDGQNLILTRPDGKQYKASIVRRARATAE